MSQIRNVDTHVIRYAKGHYQASDNVMDDLRKVYAVRNRVDPEHIQDKDILEMVASLMYELTINDMNKFWFSQIVSALFIPIGDLFHTSTTDMRTIVARLLQLIKNVVVTEGDREVLPLDPPDPNILPLTNNHIRG